MPRVASYPASILALISSTSYPALPNLEDLELIRQALLDHRTGLGSGPGSAQYKRKRDDSVTAGVLESGEKPGRGLEGAVKGSPGLGLSKVKKERSRMCIPLFLSSN